MFIPLLGGSTPPTHGHSCFLLWAKWATFLTIHFLLCSLLIKYTHTEQDFWSLSQSRIYFLSLSFSLFNAHIYSSISSLPFSPFHTHLSLSFNLMYTMCLFFSVRFSYTRKRTSFSHLTITTFSLSLSLFFHALAFFLLSYHTHHHPVKHRPKQDG